MMHDLLLDALLLMILWLYAMLLWVWLRRQVTTSHADHQPAKRATRHLQDPKPFPGLTTKPCCPTAGPAALPLPAATAALPAWASTSGGRPAALLSHAGV